MTDPNNRTGFRRGLHRGRTLAMLAPVLAGLTLGSGLGGCSVNPATGARSLTLMSWDEERQIGAEAGPSMTAGYGGAVTDAVATAYVNEVGQKLLGGIEEGVPQLDWEFTLLDSEVLNAFALPGGKVFFSRGLAKELKSEAEMAGVIGHEIGHVTARHGNQRMSKQLGFNIILGIGAVAIGAADESSTFRQYGEYAVPALAVGGNIVLLKYGRDEELQADMLGVRYMSRAGYDPVGQQRVMQTLGRLGGGGGQIEWLSTHPLSSTRVSRIQSMLEGEYAHTQNNPEFVLNADAYTSRMLDRLSALPPPKHTAVPPEAASLNGLEHLGPTLAWCAHCKADSLAMVD
ncbi:MAG: putative Zn-dependent protease [Phycisphaerales bacterium]|jgi:predicted Zn-dependent protease